MDIDEFLNQETKEGERKESASGQSPPSPEAPQGSEKRAQHPGDLASEITEIRNLLGQKRFEEAYSRYLQAKERFAELTKKQHEEQKRIYNELEEINRQMVEGLTNLKQETSRKIEVIRQLIAKADEHQENNRMDAANQLFEQIEALFGSLQEVLPDEKLRLEHEIASLHVKLASRRNMAASADFRSKFNTIGSMVQYAFENIRQGDIDKAVQLYQRINSMYGELPKGFLYEKAVLYQKILKLFNEVSHIQEGSTVESGDKKPNGK